MLRICTACSVSAFNYHMLAPGNPSRPDSCQASFLVLGGVLLPLFSGFSTQKLYCFISFLINE